MLSRSSHRQDSLTTFDRAHLRQLLAEYTQTRSPRLREELVHMHLNIVRYLASKFANRGEPIEDLIQVGSMGLLKAIDRFDPDRGVEFITYAMPTVLGEIKRYFRDKGWAVRVPRRLQELSLAVNRAAETMTVELGRSVTVEDIAERLKATCEEIIEAQELGSAYCTLSLDAPALSEERSKATTLSDRLGDEDPGIELSDDRACLKRACRRLDPQEKIVIHLRFFEELSQVEIARRMGVSQMQISRLQQRAIVKIRQGLQAS
ncbi:MAG TPA: SigB/SigF/SigG family RNA polymerase sigma factor [Candidatus Acidoferrales bacterium]|nr:SigB/SigF/SigG family RNA polymerase sigma factor [Candidatus Acidoferrales bacterium]